MLQISRMADYAVLLVATMAATPHTKHTAPLLALETGLGEATVSKILKLLTRHGVLTSTRGAAGGYALARPPAQVSMATVVAAIDGPIALTWCCNGGGNKSFSAAVAAPCPITDFCHVQHHWAHINKVVVQALEQVSVQDIALPAKKQNKSESCAE